MSARGFKLAAAQYPIDWLEGWQAYVEKLTGWVEEAAGQGAGLLVFPEYGAMELASLFPHPTPGDLVGQLEAVASPKPLSSTTKIAGRFQTLARL